MTIRKLVPVIILYLGGFALILLISVILVITLGIELGGSIGGILMGASLIGVAISNYYLMQHTPPATPYVRPAQAAGAVGIAAIGLCMIVARLGIFLPEGLELLPPIAAM